VPTPNAIGFGDLSAELGDESGDELGDPLAELGDDSDVPPQRRAPQTFQAVDVPISQLMTLPQPPEDPSPAALPSTVPGPFEATIPPATPTMPTFVPPPPAAPSTPPVGVRPMPAMPPRQPPPPNQPRQPAPQASPPIYPPNQPPPIYPPNQPPPPVYPPRQPPPPSSPPPIGPMPFGPPPGMQSPFAQQPFGPPPPYAPPSPGIAPIPIPIAPQVPVFSPAAIPRARPPVVLDVTPRGLGIGTVAGYCEELIRRNSRLPAEMRKMFTTSRDMQELVRIVVCQGESRRLENNVVLGDLVLEGLPPRARGETSIEVTFTLDVSGILQVSARDAQTGAERRASVDLLGAMPNQDVDSARERLQSLKR
jgi:molecular chaperone DnaK